METKSMSAMWIATLVSSLICYLFKILGYTIPESFLANPRVQRINTLIPIVLLSSLVGVQTITNKSEIVFDQRVVGVAVAAIALKFKAPFPVVIFSAALTSAALYNWL